MDLVGSGGGGNSNNVAVGVGGIGIGGVVTTNVGGSLGSENGPILYSEPNRTSAIDDIRSVVIYIFIITIFLSFFLILPGIRYEKFPTFLCITTSLIVTSIILVTLFGTSWHVGEAPISAAYKAFSRDRIQGDLSVRIGLQSVNITLQAHKYYILHATHGPIIMDNSPIPSSSSILQQMASSSSSLSSQPPTTTTTTTTNTDNQQLATNTQSISSFSKSISEEGEDTSKVSSSSFLDNDNDYSLESISQDRTANVNSSPANNLAEELLGGRTSDGATVDTELEVEEVFANSKSKETSSATLLSSSQQKHRRTARSSVSNGTKTSTNGQIKKRSTEIDKQQISNRTKATTTTSTSKLPANGKQQNINTASSPSSSPSSSSSPPQSSSSSGQKYTIKRVNVDINYNERFYWIEPNQMRQEHHNALERGLPYPILTVVEYLSQDAAGFSWSRQYRLAGYYSYITLWLSLCVCILMFFLHCAAPQYGIYTMQILGCLLLFTNFTYATLVPRGEQKLVIPFEGQSLTFDFGWNFWLVLFGGCLSLTVGTLIVVIDYIFPNFIFTTVLDVDFDSHNKYYKHRMRRKSILNEQRISNSGGSQIDQRPVKPPFFHDSSTSTTTSSPSSSLASNSKTSSPQSLITSSSTKRSQLQLQQQQHYNSETKTAQLRAVVATSRQQQHSSSSARNCIPLKVTNNDVVDESTSHLDELFVDSNKRLVLTSDSEFVIPSNRVHMRRGQDSSVVEILDQNDDEDRADITTGDSVVTSDTYQQNRWHKQATTTTNRGKQQHHRHHHYSHSNRNKNMSTTDHLSRRQVVMATDDSGDDHDVRL